MREGQQYQDERTLSEMIQDWQTKAMDEAETTSTPDTETHLDEISRYLTLAKEFHRIARQRNNGKFHVDDNNKVVLQTLCGYFADSENCALDPKKGIMLAGGVGVGKTEIIYCFFIALHNLSYRYPQFRKHRFSIKTSRECAQNYQRYGYDGLEFYTRPMTASNPPRVNHFAFDDLGVETNKKFFGNEINPMGEIICDRYDRAKWGCVTHFTTNLTMEQIAEVYGDRVQDRVIEMCNYVVMKGNSRRI